VTVPAGHGVAATADELRRSFDASFAEDTRAETAEFAAFLAIRVATERRVVRLAEVAGLFAEHKVTRVPSAVSEFLGFAGIRGKVVPVYDLGRLLGCKGGEPRWILLARQDLVALAFHEMDGYVRADRASIATTITPGGEPSQEVLPVHGKAVRIVHLNSVIEVIKRRIRSKALVGLDPAASAPAVTVPHESWIRNKQDTEG
jgi:chemotaxis signal transduction protein